MVKIHTSTAIAAQQASSNILNIVKALGNNTFKVRLGSEKDFEAVNKLMNDILATEFLHGPELIKESEENDTVAKELSLALEEDGYFLVVENNNGELIGSGALMRASHTIHQGNPDLWSGEKVAELTKIYLHPNYRGQGIGKWIVEALLEQAKKLGYKKAYIAAFKEFETANHIYLKAGFTVIPNRQHLDDLTVEMEREL